VDVEISASTALCFSSFLRMSSLCFPSIHRIAHQTLNAQTATTGNRIASQMPNCFYVLISMGDSGR
jgi:hypothetical protein